MFRTKFNYIFFAIIFLGGMVYSQDFTGEYVIHTESGVVTLTLQVDRQGLYQGALQGAGNSFDLEGMVQDGFLTGRVGEQGVIFQAQLSGNSLTLRMVETDGAGNPIAATAQTFVFQRRSGSPGNEKPQEKPQDRQIVINGTALNPAQIEEIRKMYGVEPKPGNYWYDARSGLYGVMGYPAFGFMLPGHKFGTLDSQASRGNTGVFVNGRELPLNEYTVWSYIVGNWIQPGRYWLDGNGNAGYEGSPIPVINLYAAAQQNAYRGQGSGGDNFWSTRFSAGNSNANNTQGYVSVPGYGPVGYGF